MLYLYDEAIVEDLKKSFQYSDTAVKVVSPDQIIPIVAQIQEDQIQFPVVALERPDSIEIDSRCINFTMMHKGIDAVFDKSTNDIYKEKAVPINLSYLVTVLATNQADMDELIRELMFKYISMYFLSIKIPYEGNRKISFGVTVDQDYGIVKKSGSSEYTETGQLYQSCITLKCDGCVLLHYTPMHLKRNVIEIAAQ